MWCICMIFISVYFNMLINYFFSLTFLWLYMSLTFGDLVLSLTASDIHCTFFAQSEA